MPDFSPSSSEVLFGDVDPAYGFVQFPETSPPDGFHDDPSSHVLNGEAPLHISSPYPPAFYSMNHQAPSPPAVMDPRDLCSPPLDGFPFDSSSSSPISFSFSPYFFESFSSSSGVESSPSPLCEKKSTL
mmetsp:Transcript_25506/g.35321  ORF Transcript_25506/g.35321 Transcript_25506/m.35321 type:complete len:129 (-) Transcript_25506:229-615(-)